MTVRQLIAVDTARLSAAGREWAALARTVATHAAKLDREVLALQGHWTGAAAEAATALLADLGTELDSATPDLYLVAQALAEHAATLARAQEIAVSAQATAGCYRITVADDGTATVDRTGDRPDPGDRAAADAVTGHLHRALSLAEGSDAATAARLAPAAPTGSAPPAPPGTHDPVDVSRWWRGLSPAQRRALIDGRPEWVGGLDGVPAADRDVANRVTLARLLADPSTPHRAGLLAIRARLDAPGPVPVYLLDVSADGAGRAIVAYGDPDTADNVVTSVPGLAGRLDHVADELARIGSLSAAARTAAPDRSTSVIAWLGYDAPDSLPSAARRGPAVGAGPDLHRFQAGLRATHTGTRSHNTVVGLSYGSTVVGLTGRAYGLDADDVILIGSPGTGVAHAADLGLDPGHVWASTARHDAINAAADPRDLGVPPLLRPILGVHTDRLWFGPSPTNPGYGAHVFASAPGSPADPVGAHIGYFDPDNPALATMADIVASE